MADSSLSYLAGVAAESNINAAIRAEEQRAHAAQVRSLSAQIDELQANVRHWAGKAAEYGQHGNMMNAKYRELAAHAEAQAAALAQAESRIRQLEQALAQQQKQAKLDGDAHFIYQMNVKREVELMARDVLSRVLAGIETQYGISLAEQAQTLQAQVEAACPLTFEWGFELRFAEGVKTHIQAILQATGGKYTVMQDASALEGKLYTELLTKYRD